MGESVTATVFAILALLPLVVAWERTRVRIPIVLTSGTDSDGVSED